MNGLPIEILDKYGVAVFLSVCVCGFLWFLIRVMSRLLERLTTQISNERERWEKIVDNHLTSLNTSQKTISESLVQSSTTLTQLNLSHREHDENCEKCTNNLTEATRILKSIDDNHSAHDGRQTVDHSQSATEHAVIMERLPKGKNGYRKRKRK